MNSCTDRQISSSTVQKGFSLVELVVVIAIIGTLASIVSINFSEWQQKYQIERQTREMFTDINDARLRSVHSKKRHGIVFNTSSFVMKNYSTGNEDSSDGTVLYSKNLSYQLTKKDGSALSNECIVFDTRGFIEDDFGQTIAVNPLNSSAACNCIAISTARTNMGKIQNGQCIY